MRPMVAATMIVFLLGVCCLAAEEQGADQGWIRLFDGKTLEGWKASDHEDSFSVRDGAIIVKGPRAHLFYVGPVENHDFKDFDFKADVMTMPNSNSGLYFHTRFQPTGWPDWGYEVQINHSHGDSIKTGSLYDIRGVRKSPAEDNVWYTLEINVRGKRITTKVNGKTIVDFTEPEDFRPPSNHPKRQIGSGTFAIQAHDPRSEVHVKNIMVKPVAD